MLINVKDLLNSSALVDYKLLKFELKKKKLDCKKHFIGDEHKAHI